MVSKTTVGGPIPSAPAMFEERIVKLRNVIRAADADAFLLINHELSGQPGTRYLSGFSGSESVLVITQKENFIFADGRYHSQVKEQCPDFELMHANRFASFEALEKICQKLKLKKIVVDTSRTYCNAIAKLTKDIPDISVIARENVLQEIRIIKDNTEQAHIQKATDIAKDAFTELLNYVREGVTEKELALRFETLMRVRGAEKVSFDLIVVSGLNGAKPHGMPSEKKLLNGELITFDFGCFFNGYASDITRTVALGSISDKLAEIYGIVRTAQELGCKAAKAGISGHDLDKICRDYIANKGYGDYFLHSTGHGLGMEVHELPYVSAGNQSPLPENSVVTVEPGIYIEGLGGVRIEDALILEKDSNLNLSEKIPKELIII